MNTSNAKKHAEREEVLDLGALFDGHIAREFADHDQGFHPRSSR